MNNQEKTEGDSFVKISFIKRMLLFVNVSAYRTFRAVPGSSNYRQNYRDASFSVFAIVFTEYVIINYIFPKQMGGMEAIRPFIVVFAGYHGLAMLFFMKDITRMSMRYNDYYNRPLFYLSLAFLAIGFWGVLVMFNNSIGHVTK